MLGQRPRSCGHQPGRVASNGHDEDEVSQLPGFARLPEGAQCDSLASSIIERHSFSAFRHPWPSSAVCVLRITMRLGSLGRSLG
jgi:hypothetical protein